MTQMVPAGKSALRREFSARRKALSLEFRHAADQTICRRIRQLAAFREATAVAGFIAFGAEPDLSCLFEEKRWFLPRFSAELGAYEMVEVRDRSRELVIGRYGIPEPAPALPAAPPELVREELFFLVPAMACDRRGVRLGRGGGYYDRLLTGAKRPPAAVIYSCQIAAELPCEAHDLRMAWVISEAGTIEVV